LPETCAPLMSGAVGKRRVERKKKSDEYRDGSTD
jgi:hypothetical protein